MDTSKIVNELKEIGNHTEHLKRIEELLARLLESQARSERYLELMWHVYEQMQHQQQQPK